MSLPEVLLWTHLRRRRLEGLHVRKQHPVGPYILDFYCSEARLCIEVDGATHHLGHRPELDLRRDAWLREHGIATLRLSAALVLKDMDTALRTILGAALARILRRQDTPAATPTVICSLAERQGTDATSPGRADALGEDLRAPPSRA